MNWLGYRQVRIASIHVEAADIKKRTKAAHVAELAGDIRARGEEPIHAPTIRAKDRKLLCGRDRVAALLCLKVKKIWCHVVECDDKEAKELELAENIYRRADNRSELIAQLVSLKEQQIAAQRAAAEPGTVSQAPYAQPRAIARKAVAKAAGISPAAVRKAEQRAAKNDSGAGPGRAGTETPSEARRESAASSSPEDMTGSGGAAGATQEEDVQPLTLDLLGLGVDDDGARAVMDLAVGEQAAIDDADKHLRLAQSALSRFSLAVVQQELKEQVRRVASMVRAARPEAICPWCKGLPQIAKCEPCHTLGWVTAEKRERAPKELREGPPMVAIDGVFYPYADVRDGKLPAKNGKAAKPEKRIKTVLGDGAGNEIEFVPDEEQAY